MQDVDGSTADLLKEAGRMVQELARESRRNWETRARNQAMRMMHVASEAYESLGARRVLGPLRPNQVTMGCGIKSFFKVDN